jgi:hypothetical protein
MSPTTNGITMAAETSVLRVGDLCGRDVLGTDGQLEGKVLDVRVVQDGPVGLNGMAALRVDGLVVGSGQLVERLGLFRHRVHGPWLLRFVARLVGPSRTYLPWSQVIDPLSLANEKVVRFIGDLARLPD